jgi:ATP-dependent DNA helicase RecQ
VVFHDATLAEMVERRPRTLDQLAHISGIGQRKLEAYGRDFLEVIMAHEYDEGRDPHAAAPGYFPASSDVKT